MMKSRTRNAATPKNCLSRSEAQGSARWQPRQSRLIGCLLLAVFCLCAIAGHAQTNLSSITGTVVDSGGAAIANCKVVVTNLSTTAVRQVTTDSNGFYSVPALPVGSYSVRATTSGFETSNSNVELTLNGVTANFTLKVGTVSQSVTVNAGSGTVALQTESHDISQTFSPTQLINLPNQNGVSILSIATLGPATQAGTDSNGNLGDESFYGQSGNAVNFAGLGVAHTQFLQDGVENVNLLTQTANVVSTVEASAGVTTTLNGSPARFGQPAVINVITKSGTNQFHGMVYDFLQNDAMNATNYFAVTKPPLRYNLFGGDLGAPIIKNKLFGYFDYSGLRSHSDVVSQNRVPTAAERSGNFAGDNISGTIYDPATYNPATGSSSPFPGNVISPTRFNNFAKLWLDNYPLPNYPLGLANINYVANVPSISTSDEEISRADWNMSERNQVTATFFHFTSSTGTDSIVPNLFGNFYDTSGTNAMLQDTYVINPNIVNIARVGYNRGNVTETELGVGAKNYAQYYGLNNVNPAPQQWAPPTVNITAYTSFGAPYAPQGALQNRFQYADEVDWKLGNHSVAFGGEFVRSQFNGNWVVLNNAQYTFDGSATSEYINGQRSTTSTGNGFADLLLGYPQSATVADGTSVGDFRESQVAGYIQDDWKIRPNLTLNLGLRYDWDNPPIDKNGKSALYDLATNAPIPGTWNTNYNDWGPRFGFAWSVNNKTVVRGGYGVYYSPILYNNLQFSLLYAPNFVLQSHTINIADPVNTENQFGPSSTGNSGYTIEKTLKDQSAQEWNLNVQQSLNVNTLLTIAYIGDVLRHQSARADSNQPYALSPGNTSGILDVKPQPLAGPVTTQLNFLNANYNGLAVTLNRRYSNGLQFLASYTWSKTIDIVDGDNSDVQDYHDVNLQRAPASFDRTNNFIFSGIYDLPFGPGRKFANSNNWINREVIGGWQLSGVQQLASGLPLSIEANNTADTSYAHPVYALKVCDPNAGFRKTRFDFFNPACFAQPTPGHYGTTRNVVRIPGLYPTNLSLFKGFQTYKDQQLQFRVDAFSVFNHPVFGSGTESVNSPNLGQLTYQASGLRTLQVSLKYMF